MALMNSAQFELEQKVSITVQGGRLIIEPLKQVTYSLDALVAGITPKNSHSEFSFGGPVSKELI